MCEGLVNQQWVADALARKEVGGAETDRQQDDMLLSEAERRRVKRYAASGQADPGGRQIAHRSYRTQEATGKFVEPSVDRRKESVLVRRAKLLVGISDEFPREAPGRHFRLGLENAVAQS